MLAKLSKRHPEIVGRPKCLGVTELPSRNPETDLSESITLREAFECLEGKESADLQASARAGLGCTAAAE